MPSEADLRAHSDPMHTFVERIRERDYWRALVPDLTIEGSAPRQSDPLMDADSLNLLAGHFSREGYFQCDRVVGAAAVARMRQAIERLHEARCPLAFCFVYDEFWSIASHLAPLLERFLGTGYRQLPDFWVWRLDPAREDAGWRPHRDKGFQALRPDGSPKSLTVWIALTDVTPLNGCMYVVPAHLDPPSLYVDRPDPRQPANLQDVRALPVPAGSVLGWNQALLHWGGRASRRAPEPRISFACEFQRGDIEPWNRPLLDPRLPPPFELRLALIGKQLLQYRHMYALPDALASVAQRLAELLRV